jgi:hypothetical protein
LDWTTLQEYATPETLKAALVVGGAALGLKVAWWGAKKVAAVGKAVALGVARPAVLAGALMVAGGGLVGQGTDGRRRDGDPPLPALSGPDRLNHAGWGAGLAMVAIGAGSLATRFFRQVNGY